MTDQTTQLPGPDFVAGVALSTVADGVPLLGHAHGEPVILVRRGDDLFAVGAFCTHYGGPLAEGLLVDETIRCPWHHACFSLRTGEALRAPALNPIACRRVEQRDGTVHVGDVIPPEPAPSVRPAGDGALSASIVIVGGGAAGHAAAEMLRHEGHAGTITMLSADDSLPCDRPNLSKNYLAGSAPEDWIPLRSAEFYREQRIDVKLNALVVDIDTVARQVQLEGGRRLDYGALLLATGAEPVRLAIPGADLPHVHYLRTWSDSRALVGAAKTARRAVVIGASFIGLEVAASLRARHVDVQVVDSRSLVQRLIPNPPRITKPQPASINTLRGHGRAERERSLIQSLLLTTTGRPRPATSTTGIPAGPSLARPRRGGRGRAGGSGRGSPR